MQSYILYFERGTDRVVSVHQLDNGLYRVTANTVVIADVGDKTLAAYIFNREVQKITTEWERELS